MSRLFDEMVTRPLRAFASAAEVLGQGGDASRGIDGMLSRFAHTLGSASPRARAGGAYERDDARDGAARGAEFTDDDRLILERVEGALADGRALKRWWDAKFPDGFARRFELERVFNRPDSSFGFFDEIRLHRGAMPLMGNYQEMFYDQTRTPANLNREAASWMRDQLREFVLRYFMRVSAFRQPEVYVEPEGNRRPDFLSALSWCDEPDVLRQGFGFTQHFYKLRATGEVGKFPAASESAIVDVRELGSRYEWVVVKVHIFDFAFTFRPFGSGGPVVYFPLNEESWLVLSRDFILEEDDPSRDTLGRYGVGYSFIRDPTQGLIAYGPGQFDAAIELIDFDVSARGEVRVRMVFVVNRPERIANVSLNPFDWGFRVADLFSFGAASRIFAPVREALERVPSEADGFDPVYGFVSLANALSGGQAAEQLCISREQLEKDFLAQHFSQHYATLVGSLLTWRQIPDWLDTAALPAWVVTGRSS
ncbi:MAG TPA: hypothetical protein VGP08_17490 [Pyrinomonadaceae bacterium]|jgi:hypothetical protein|nr:hypothetical protein [Pyrinomonadaceae bacterium]